MKQRANKRSRAKIRVKGVVQGVGFRPFVYKHAVELHLTGYVKNLGAHVDIDVEGSYDAIVRLIELLKQGAPISRIDDVHVEWRHPYGYTEFSIASSGEGEFGFTSVSYTHLRAHETPEHLV